MQNNYTIEAPDGLLVKTKKNDIRGMQIAWIGYTQIRQAQKASITPKGIEIFRISRSTYSEFSNFDGESTAAKADCQDTLYIDHASDMPGLTQKRMEDTKIVRLS